MIKIFRALHFSGVVPLVILAGMATAQAEPVPVGLNPGPMSRAEAAARSQAMAALGRKMFFDPSLSASGTEACSFCHDPARGFGSNSAAPIMMGGPNLDRPGVRAVPSLRYLQVVPQFTEHFYESEDEGDESVDNGATGGLTWDGRVDGGAAQARIPLFAANEMANKDEPSLAKALAGSAYAGEMKALFGAEIFAHPSDAVEAAVQSIGAFEQTPALFYPYSSRYDAYLDGKGTLTAEEREGLKLFEDEAKGNCASCHRSQKGRDGTPPQFSDFGMIALAVPRNVDIPANADPAYHDYGLCGPYRTDFLRNPDYCGLFRSPSLRNVALKQSFMHNGFFHSLRDVVAFYATRDTDPARWYGRNPDGSAKLYNDLPRDYWGNINQDPPFGRKAGEVPALNDAEIDAIVAFLKTLTDADLTTAAKP